MPSHPPIPEPPGRSRRRAFTLPVAALLLAPLFTVSAVVTTTAPAAASAVPPTSLINPKPQQLQVTGSDLALGDEATIIAGEDADPAAVETITTTLSQAGIRSIVNSDGSASAQTAVYVGTGADDPTVSEALRRLGAQSPAGLAPEGYSFATGKLDGRVEIALAGVDAAGTFYGAQTFAQLLTASAPGQFPSVSVRDWPGFRIRGGMESFYGDPWPADSRLDQLRFLARNKMNTYFWGVAGDPQTGQTWSKPYTDEQLAELRSAVELAQRLHIQFVYRISPENPLDPAHGICHSSQTDRDLLIARFQQLWDVGVRAYTIAWDDVSGHFACAADQTVYGSDVSPIAAAQTAVDNDVINRFLRTHSGAQPLWTVPTEYWGDAKSTYRSRFDTLLDSDAIIYWTGPSVVSESITPTDLDATRAAFPRHQILIWDNYPVNDYAPGNLLLAPVTGRSAGLEANSVGITFNELQEQSPSQIPMSTAADYSWNPTEYDPTASWDRALRVLGGDDYSALRTFAENNSVGPARLAGGPTDPAPRIGPALTTLRDRYDKGADLSTEAASASQQLKALADAADTLAAGESWPLFAQEAGRWITRSRQLGRQGVAAAQALSSQHDGDHAVSWQFLNAMRAGGVDVPPLPVKASVKAWRHAANPAPPSEASPVTVAGTVIDTFISRAIDEAALFTGASFYRGTGTVEATPAAANGSTAAATADGNPLTAYRAASATHDGDSLTVPLTTARVLNSVVVLQDPAHSGHGTLSVHSASGWTVLGALHGSYTALVSPALNGAAVDAVRVNWAPDQQPTVNEVIPVYADALPVSISAPGAITAMPGYSRHIDVTVATALPGSVSGTVAVRGPDGWTSTEQAFTLESDNRAVSSRLSVTLTVPASAAVGTYPIQVVATDAQGHAASATAAFNVVRPPDDPYARMILADGPTAYWRLDEPSGTTALDASGDGLDATYNGSVQLGQAGTPAASPDESVRLTGGYASVPDSNALDLSGPFTLEAWVRPEHIAASPGDGVIEKYDTPANNGYILRLDGGNRLQGWTLGASGYSLVTGATSLSANTWHHLAAVFDGTSLALYVDGHLDGQVNTTVAPTAGRGSLKLGARGDDAAQRLPGNLDEVAIYSAALTAQQVAAHAAG